MYYRWLLLQGRFHTIFPMTLCSRLQPWRKQVCLRVAGGVVNVGECWHTWPVHDKLIKQSYPLLSQKQKLVSQRNFSQPSKKTLPGAKQYINPKWAYQYVSLVIVPLISKSPTLFSKWKLVKNESHFCSGFSNPLLWCLNAACSHMHVWSLGFQTDLQSLALVVTTLDYC